MDSETDSGSRLSGRPEPPGDHNRKPELPLGEIPEWFLAVAAIVYGSGFLVVFTFQSIWGLRETGLEFFRIKYIHAGLLCNLPLLILGVPIYAVWRMKRLGSKPLAAGGKSGNSKGPQEFPIPLMFMIAFMLFLLFLYAAYSFVPRARFKGWLGVATMVFIPLFLFLMVRVQVWAQRQTDRTGKQTRENTSEGDKERGKDSRGSRLHRILLFLSVSWPYCIVLFLSALSIGALLWIAGAQLLLEAFLGWGRATHGGMLAFVLMMVSIGLVLWRAENRSEEFKDKETLHGHSHQELQFWLWTVTLSVTLAFYCFYVLAFAFTVYPYIPAEKGGGSFVAASRVRITLWKNSALLVPPSLLDGKCEDVCRLKPLVIVQETPTYLYLVDPANGDAVQWRRGVVPQIYALRQDSVGSIAYSPTD